MITPAAGDVPEKSPNTGLVHFNWWDVSSGRYICYLHGGFCGSRDNYVSRCPACHESEKKLLLTPNPVARQLDYINSMRDRAKAQTGIIIVLPPILLAIWKIGGDWANVRLPIAQLDKAWLMLGSLMWLGSVLLLFIAARNYNVYNSQALLRATDVRRSLNDWAHCLEAEARRREIQYSMSNLLTAGGLTLVSLVLIPSVLRVIFSGH